MTGKPDAPTSSENWKPAAYAYRKGDTILSCITGSTPVVVGF